MVVLFGSESGLAHNTHTHTHTNNDLKVLTIIWSDDTCMLALHTYCEVAIHFSVCYLQADAGSYYTAWSSASSLVGRGLMIRKGHPPR